MKIRDFQLRPDWCRRGGRIGNSFAGASRAHNEELFGWMRFHVAFVYALPLERFYGQLEVDFVALLVVFCL